MVFTKIEVQESFSGQDVDGQSAVPQSDAEAQLALALEIELVPVDRDFEDAFEGGFRDELGIQQAHKSFFDGELLEVSALKLYDDGDFFSTADGDAKLRILEFSERLDEWIDTHAETFFFESVAHFVQVEDPSVHGPAAPFR